jgi:ribosomal protein S4E
VDSEKKILLKQLAQMGDVILVQDDGKRIKLNDDAEISLASQFDAVLYFMQRLDSGMLKLILEDYYTYQDYDKKTFLKKLSNVFDEYLRKGNTFLNVFEGKCNSTACSNLNCKGFSFVGNKTNHYMDLIIQIKESKVSDIYECHDFINENDTILKKDKIIIDGLNLPF